jgi:hypothetical protein
MTLGELHDEAKAEVAEAAAYLESQRRGYGERFIEAVESAREFVINHPRSGHPEPFDVRVWPVQGFSYSIVYTLETITYSLLPFDIIAAVQVTGARACAKLRS